MRYAVNTFKGEIPRASARLLPPSHGQIATNCRFGSGDLEPFRQFTLAKTLAAAAQTIYKLNGEWLSWNAQVDVARRRVRVDRPLRGHLGCRPGPMRVILHFAAESAFATRIRAAVPDWIDLTLVPEADSDGFAAAIARRAGPPPADKSAGS